MGMKEIYGLGAHADVPVTPEEDHAFDALSGPAQSGPVATPEALTYEQLQLRHPKPSKSTPLFPCAKP